MTDQKDINELEQRLADKHGISRKVVSDIVSSVLLFALSEKIDKVSQ